jgi:polyketide synthase 7
VEGLRASGVAGVYEDLGALGEALDGGAPLPGVVFLDCTVQGGTGRAGTDAGVAGVLGLVRGAASGVLGVLQAWLSDGRFAGCRLVVLTRGAVSVGVGESVGDMGGASVWGLVRSAQSENPGRIVLVDLDSETESERSEESEESAAGSEGVVGGVSWDALCAALALGEPQLALRGGELSVPRLAYAVVSEGEHEGEHARGEALGEDRLGGADGASGVFGAGGTVLITGGTGGLGGLVARHLVAVHGVSSVVLASRRGGEAPGALELERELSEMGARVAIAACDVSDRDQLEGLLGQIPEAYPLTGVVHAAGVLDDGVIESLSAERIDRVFAAKVDAAWYLHELTEHLGLSAFVLFSSGAATLSSPGQGNYAAANTLLDALAAYRRARGLSGISMAWGQWASASDMAADLRQADYLRMARAGLAALSPEEGLALFDAALHTDQALVLPVRLDLAVLRARARAGATPPLLSRLVRAPSHRAEDEGSLARRLASLPEQDRESTIVDFVRAEVAIVLGHSTPQAIDIQQAFRDLGFDSLTAVELRNRLSTVTGLRLPATLIFDYPTITTLANHLLTETFPGFSRDTHLSPGEAEIREALARIPLGRLREAGLIEPLLQLANLDGEALRLADEDETSLVDTMDVERLVQRTLTNTDPSATEP